MRKNLYVLLLFFCYNISAQTPVLMSDLIGSSYGMNKPMIMIGSTLYFQANDGVNGSELWKTDGTTPGTVMVKDINPLDEESRPGEFAVLGSTLYFSAYESSKGEELWKSDGTPAGTVIVKDIAPNFNSGSPRMLKNYNNTLYFIANGSTELWKSDGTTAGTVPIKSMPANAYITSIILGGNKLFFTLSLQSGSEQLWKTDGTLAGTVMVKEFSQSTYGHIAHNNTLFFGANDGISGMELWKSDGTPAGTVLVKDIGDGSFGSSPTFMTSFNNLVYFSAFGNLYRTDGTSAGTVIVSNLNGYYLTNVNGVLYFGHEADGYEIYKYNGTTFTKLKYFPRYDNQALNLRFIGFNDGTVFFNSKESEHGEELWQTNGTPGATVLAKDIRPGVYSGFPNNFIVSNGATLYFTASDGASGFEVWKKAGAANATMIKDIEPNIFSSNPNNLARLNSILFLNATDYYNTQMYVVNTANPYPHMQGIGVKNPSNFMAFNNKMYFQSEKYNGRELFVSDGASAMQIKDIYTGSSGGVENSSSPTDLTSVGSNFYFAATSNGDRELWKSDGTEIGTVLLKNIDPVGSSSPNHLIEFGGNLYFFASIGTVARVYKYDALSAVTSLMPITTPPDDYTVNTFGGQIAKTTSTLYIQANSTNFGNELYKLNGSSLSLVKDIRSGDQGGIPNSSNPSNFTPVNSRLYFTANNSANGTELWKTDGLETNTMLVKDILSGSGSSNINNLINFNGTLFFSASNGTNGQELWKSDGTDNGTIMVKDINIGNGGSNPSNFCVVGNTLYFNAFHPRYGIELWKTDGTESGTVLVYDMYQDADGESNDGNPTKMINVNGTLFFAANNGYSGNELFYFKPCPATGVFSQYTFPPNYTYHASQTIEAAHKIINGNAVNYLAGKSVTLNPGFSVAGQDNVSTRGNIFRAEARGCN